MLERVIWLGGPHDGLVQSVLRGEALQTARVCHCHGALYVAEPFDGCWRLVYATSWRAEKVSSGTTDDREPVVPD